MLSVVIPIKNEPDIDVLTTKLHFILNNSNIEHEIIIVTENSSNLKSLLNAKIVFNYADTLERAILTGFSVSKYDNIIVMDGDGQHPLDIVPIIYKELNNNNEDIVIASRFIEGGSTGRMSPYRRVVSKTFNNISSIMGVKITDPMSGFFGVKKDIVKDIEFKPFKWKVLYEILYKNRKNNINIKEIPYEFNKRDKGISSTSSSVGIKIAWDMLSVSGKLQLIGRSIITVGLFIGILSMMNVSQLINVFSMVDLRYVLYGILCYTLMTSIMSYRLYKILHYTDNNITFIKTFFAHSFGMLSSDIGFGKIGYITTASVLANNMNVKLDDGLSAILGIQSIELIVKGIVATISIITIVIFMKISLVLMIPALIGIGVIIILGIIGIILLFYNPYWLEDVPILGQVAGYFQKYPQFKSSFLFIVEISLICWVIQGLGWYFIGLSLNLSIPFLVFLALHPILTSIKFIPLTPASLGIFDLAVIWGMSIFGVPVSVAFAFGLIERFNSLIDLVALKELIMWKTKKW